MPARLGLGLSLSLFALIAIISGSYLPPIWPDEVLFYSPSFELYKNGVMRTSVEAGLIPGMESFTLWMTPGFIILQAGLFQLFPPSIITSRLFVSFLALIALLVFYFFLKNTGVKKETATLTTFLLSTDFLFIRISHCARMESLCLLLFLVSILILSFSQKQSRKPSSGEIFFSGISLSLSFLSHPFGAVFSLIVLYLLFEWKSLNLKNISLYIISGILPISVWLFLYVIPNWDLFLIQFGSQLSRKNELFGVFSQLTKIKIILSGFPLPSIKGIVLLLSLPICFYLVSWKKNFLFRFSVVWSGIIFIFLYLSSESWYVYYISVPLSLLFSVLLDEENKTLQFILGVAIIFNLGSLAWVYGSHFYFEIPQKNQSFFLNIEKEIKGYNSIYLQSIPDPYFYLKEKYPQKELLEFIPGELPVKSKDFQATIQKQEAFIFYNKELINPIVKKYLNENSLQFNIKEIHIPTPPSQTRLYALLYLKK